MNLRELISILGHELRTPLAAILGYQELLAEGIYGPVDARQQEPLDRIQRSAEQILSLIDGLQELADAGRTRDDETTDTDTQKVQDAALERLRPFADARGVRLEGSSRSPDPLLHFSLQRFLRAIEIAGAAAVKASNGRTLELVCQRNGSTVTCTIAHTNLDVNRDDPGQFDLAARHDVPPNAAQLRLAMARATLEAAGGSLGFQSEPEGTALQMTLPAKVTDD